MKKMQIFEPAMCCSTGLCGVGVDPELLRISAALNVLEKGGIHVERFNLSNSPQQFVADKTVNRFIHTKGVDGLPVTVVDGEIVIAGRYPTNEEFAKLLGVPENLFGGKPKVVKVTRKPSGGCGCSGGKCCGFPDESPSLKKSPV